MDALSTGILIVISPTPAPVGNGLGSGMDGQISRVVQALGRTAHSHTSAAASGSVTWVLSQRGILDLSADAKQLLKHGVTEYRDDLILQGVYGIPHGVLGGRELHFEQNVSETEVARAIGVPRSAIRRIRAPVEPDTPDAEPTQNTRVEFPSRILGLRTEPQRTRRGSRGTRLWIRDNGRLSSIRTIRLREWELRSARAHATFRRQLRQWRPLLLIVDAYDDHALENLKRIAGTVVPERLALPDQASPENAPARSTTGRMRPLIRLCRTPLWHAQLLAMAEARPKSADSRVSGSVLRAFARPSSSLGRSPRNRSALAEQRVVHASMYGAAEMDEAALHIRFKEGSVVGISGKGEDEAQVPTVPADPGGLSFGRRWVPFRAAGAFSFDWDTVRGLTTRIIGQAEQNAPAERVVTVDTDYILMDGLPWLIVHTSISYPTEKLASTADGADCYAAPLPIPLGRSLGMGARIHSRLHDGAARTIDLDEKSGGDSTAAIQDFEAPPHPFKRRRRSGAQYIRVPSAEMTVEIGERTVHIVFIDNGERLAWEPALELHRERDATRIRLLPFGTFNPRPQGVLQTSILFGIAVQREIPDVEELRRRTLRVLSAPSCLTGES